MRISAKMKTLFIRKWGLACSTFVTINALLCLRPAHDNYTLHLLPVVISKSSPRLPTPLIRTSPETEFIYSDWISGGKLTAATACCLCSTLSVIVFECRNNICAGQSHDPCYYITPRLINQCCFRLGGPYAAFGGRDASRGLATFSVTASEVEYDDLSDLTPPEMDSVREWEMQFKGEFTQKIKNKRRQTHFSSFFLQKSTNWLDACWRWALNFFRYLDNNTIAFIFSPANSPRATLMKTKSPPDRQTSQPIRTSRQTAARKTTPSRRSEDGGCRHQNAPQPLITHFFRNSLRRFFYNAFEVALTPRSIARNPSRGVPFLFEYLSYLIDYSLTSSHACSFSV